jgi:hypothetical protein
MRTLVLVLGLASVGAISPLVPYAEEPSEAAQGQPRPGIRCEELVFCAGVKDLTPVGASATFPSDIFRVYCYTTLVGAEDTTTVVHNWYYADAGMATVELPVKSSRWRTWSSKRMVSGWRGRWKVEVTSADGMVIESREFTLE